jgi:hypothetical protein
MLLSYKRVGKKIGGEGGWQGRIESIALIEKKRKGKKERKRERKKERKKDRQKGKKGTFSRVYFFVFCRVAF